MMSRTWRMLIGWLLLTAFSSGVGGCRAASPGSSPAAIGTPSARSRALSNVRGFDYAPAGVRGYANEWLHYDPAEARRDLGYARRLNLNLARVFLSYKAWAADRALTDANLADFIRAAHERGIDTMPVLVDRPRGMMNNLFDPASQPLLRAWAADLVNAVGREPGLSFWDVANEPDTPTKPAAEQRNWLEIAKFMADTLHELQHKVPVTIGFAIETYMEQYAGSVDVLTYHDYGPTRAAIRENLTRAQKFADTVNKPVMTTEIGCIGRANPYDVAIQEQMRAGMGWCIWELMITQHWGTIHGVFYADGTVRDPTIAAAIMGCFRNRGEAVVVETPDRERHLTTAITEARVWLDESPADWAKGLDLAETMANLLESAQLAAMREPPTRTVDLLRAGSPNVPALQSVVRRFIALLEPYRIIPKAPTSATAPAN